MERQQEDPVLQLIDAVLRDLSARGRMYVGRRRQEENAETFMIQAGEDGRHRLPWPELDSDASIEAVVADAQAYLGQILDVPLPLCPLHHHSLVGKAREGVLVWECPDGQWSCALGDYADATWPQLDVKSLAPTLCRRIQRRGITGWVTLGVTQTANGSLVELSVEKVTPELTRALQDAAAPLPVSLREHRGPRPRRLGAVARG